MNNSSIVHVTQLRLLGHDGTVVDIINAYFSYYVKSVSDDTISWHDAFKSGVILCHGLC